MGTIDAISRMMQTICLHCLLSTPGTPVYSFGATASKTLLGYDTVATDEGDGTNNCLTDLTSSDSQYLQSLTKRRY